MKNSTKEFNRESLRQAQKIMLYIMKRIHEVCVKNNIRYWLDYGTLLGAVRHDGFIPWDDDMDISMMREDYEKFCKIAPQELGDEFFWQTRDTEPDFAWEYGKVRLKNTLWLEKKWVKSPFEHKGMFVDIHPCDPFPKTKLSMLYLTIFSTLCNVLLNYKIKKACTNKLFFKIVTIISSMIFSKKFCADWMIKKVKKLQKLKNKSPMCGKLFDASPGNWCERSVFDKLVLKRFEDTEFYIPEKYDIRLSKLYGNYMTPPAEGQCSGHHNIVDFDFGKYDSL